MATIDMGAALNMALQRLEGLETGAGVALHTWKRDRSVTITKTGPDLHHVAVDGFRQEVYTDLDRNSLRKKLKTLFKREFPRSNQLRLTLL